VERSIHHFPDFPSEFLPHRRPVTVWTPPDYTHDPLRRFPVFYLHDGQNLFDPATAFGGVAWRCDETAARVIHDGTARSMILVGVGNSPDRLGEYGPKRGGREPNLAESYGRFLVEELIPFIDRTFRTQTGPRHTAVGGSSMGGLISLYLACWHPTVFGLCGAMSPSLWWDKQAFLKELRTKTGWLYRTRLWLDMGGREGATDAVRQGNVERTRKLGRHVESIGRREGEDFRYLELPEAEHNERDWSGRFDQVLRFLFRPDWNI
jgi:predicted alpha/beta superfamily hydrolase